MSSLKLGDGTVINLQWTRLDQWPAVCERLGHMGRLVLRNSAVTADNRDSPFDIESSNDIMGQFVALLDWWMLYHGEIAKSHFWADCPENQIFIQSEYGYDHGYTEQELEDWAGICC